MIVRPLGTSLSTVMVRFGIRGVAGRGSLRRAIRGTLHRVRRGRCSARLLTEKVGGRQVHRCKFTFHKGGILVKARRWEG